MPRQWRCGEYVSVWARGGGAPTQSTCEVENHDPGLLSNSPETFVAALMKVQCHEDSCHAMRCFLQANKALHWDQQFKKEFVKANSRRQPRRGSPSAHPPRGMATLSSPNPTQSTTSSPLQQAPISNGDRPLHRKQIDSPSPSPQACRVCISPVKWDEHQTPVPSQGSWPHCEWSQSEVY